MAPNFVIGDVDPASAESALEGDEKRLLFCYVSKGDGRRVARSDARSFVVSAHHEFAVESSAPSGAKRAGRRSVGRIDQVDGSRMKTIVLYGSSRETTRRIVSSLAGRVHFPFDVVDLRSLDSARTLLDYELLVFFCPTYGDDEPQEDVERFLRDFDQDLGGRYFAVCGLGSYDGYGFFEPAGGRILREELLDHGGVEAVEALSLDSMPTVDQKRLDGWCDLLDSWVGAQCRTTSY